MSSWSQMKICRASRRLLRFALATAQLDVWYEAFICCCLDSIIWLQHSVLQKSKIIEERILGSRIRFHDWTSSLSRSYVFCVRTHALRPCEELPLEERCLSTLFLFESIASDQCLNTMLSCPTHYVRICARIADLVALLKETFDSVIRSYQRKLKLFHFAQIDLGSF